jgi:hypothetical protein
MQLRMANRLKNQILNLQDQIQPTSHHLKRKKRPEKPKGKTAKRTGVNN